MIVIDHVDVVSELREWRNDRVRTGVVSLPISVVCVDNEVAGVETVTRNGENVGSCVYASNRIECFWRPAQVEGGNRVADDLIDEQWYGTVPSFRAGGGGGGHIGLVDSR